MNEVLIKDIGQKITDAIDPAIPKLWNYVVLAWPSDGAGIEPCTIRVSNLPHQLVMTELAVQLMPMFEKTAEDVQEYSLPIKRPDGTK